MSRSKLAGPQFTKPSGARFFDDLPLRLRIVARLRRTIRGVLDLVLGRLRDDLAGGVEPGATRAPGDLVELAGGELPHPRAVELGERGEQHGADRHVDARRRACRCRRSPAAARAGRAARRGAGTWAACRRGARRCRRGPAARGSSPKPAEKRNPPIASAIASRCSRVATRTLGSACARSTAAACEKCTM